MRPTRIGSWGLLLIGCSTLLLPAVAAVRMNLDSYLLPDEPLEIRLDFDDEASLSFAWSVQPGRAHFSIHRVGETPQPDDFEGPNDQGTGTVEPSEPGGYAFQWASAHAQDQRIQVHLEGDAVFVEARGVHEIDPAEYSDGLPAMLAFLAFAGAILVAPRRR